MKILAISDLVDERVYSEHIRVNYPEIELVLGCGDLPLYYLEFVASMLDRPVLYVRGNHDAHYEEAADGRRRTVAEGCLPIDGRLARVLGLTFIGLGGSRRYSPGPPFQYGEGQMRRRLAALLPRLAINRLRHGRFVDVAVAHAPPYGIHDAKDPAHVGFRTFLSLMRLFRPRLLLHGHVHQWRHDRPMRSVYLETEVVGVFPVRVIEISEPPGRASVSEETHNM
ncbi:MAG TPA: metallophosphoesterase [Anaerolineales bacterium]|nr:metallophosphoesterase [Anaerolineales bacterium]